MKTILHPVLSSNNKSYIQKTLIADANLKFSDMENNFKIIGRSDNGVPIILERVEIEEVN